MASFKVYLIVFFLCVIVNSIYSKNTVERLTKRFNDVRNVCIGSHKHKRPAYECTGLIIRGVSNIGGNGSEQKHAWSKKKINKKANAFSVGFLRKDQLFHGFPKGHDAGYILYPHLKTPKGKNVYDILCAFPVDAHTDDREGHHGCGKSRTDPSGKSGHCDTQGIKTLQKWIAHYEEIMSSQNKNFVVRQCGFDTTTKHAARNFAISIEANKYLREHSQQYGWRNNELRIRGWNDKKPKKLPIEAFFFIMGSKTGEKNARLYRKDFQTKTGNRVPIVAIHLPVPGNMTFSIKKLH